MTTEVDLRLEDAPPVPGLRFRTFAGESDYQGIADTTNAAYRADGIHEHWSVDHVAAEFSHPTNYDPYRDVLVAEVDGLMIAFSRASWMLEGDEVTGFSRRSYQTWAYMRPEFRRRGIGRAMLRHQERHLRGIAEGHPNDLPREYGSFAAATEVGAIALLKAEGYQPVRYFIEMWRGNIDDIPDLPLPDGLEVRPAQPADYRRIFDAQNEAFRDHWGHREFTDERYEAELADPDFDPSLWRVAWDGDEVAGVVYNVVNAAENAALGMKLGWLRRVSVRRQWRRRGLARALVAESLRAFQERGLTSAGLGVDSENTTGALGLYEKLGFAEVQPYIAFRKPMVLTDSK